MKSSRKINKKNNEALVSLQAFFPEDQEICKIIQICNLYPIEGWRHWTDYLGYDLLITEGRKIVCRKNDKLPIIVTDIYHKSYPGQIAEISQKAMVAFAEGDICCIWFLGKDFRLRLVTFARDKWIENCPPLTSGIKTLRFLIKELNVDAPRDLKHKSIQNIQDFNFVKAWISPLPLDEKIKLEMSSNNNMLANEIFSIL